MSPIEEHDTGLELRMNFWYMKIII